MGEMSSKPPPLRPGDTIGIVAPSFFVEKQEAFARGIAALKGLGFELQLAPSTESRLENTTRPACDRAREINNFFADDRIRGIVCADGGCRAIELLGHLDYPLISRHPKLLSGFSDISHLLLAIWSKSAMRCVHGLDIVNGFGGSHAEAEQNIGQFMRLVTGGRPLIAFPGQEGILHPGRAEGILLGGWLEALLALSGSVYFAADRCDRIVLFWETVALEPSRMAHYVKALEYASWFPKVTAMLVGQLHQCVEKEYWDCAPSIRTVLERLGARHNIPVLMDLGFGHGEELASMPIGVPISIDTAHSDIRLLDSLTEGGTDTYVTY